MIVHPKSLGRNLANHLPSESLCNEKIAGLLKLLEKRFENKSHEWWVSWGKLVDYLIKVSSELIIKIFKMANFDWFARSNQWIKCKLKNNYEDLKRKCFVKSTKMVLHSSFEENSLIRSSGRFLHMTSFSTKNPQSLLEAVSDHKNKMNKFIVVLWENSF